jgi:ABC-type multidrug transport system permease subunit
MPDWLDDLIRIEIWNECFSISIVSLLLIFGFISVLISKKFDGKANKYLQSFGYASMILFAAYVLFSILLYLTGMEFIMRADELVILLVVVIAVICSVLIISGTIRWIISRFKT